MMKTNKEMKWKLNKMKIKKNKQSTQISKRMLNKV